MQKKWAGYEGMEGGGADMCSRAALPNICGVGGALVAPPTLRAISLKCRSTGFSRSGNLGASDPASICTAMW
jgi:hypothetical protein